MSHNIEAGPVNLVPMSCSKPIIQTSLLVVEAMARYSASAEERDTVFCFLVRHDNNEAPSLMQYPVREQRLIGHAAQSESQYPERCKEF